MNHDIAPPPVLEASHALSIFTAGNIPYLPQTTLPKRAGTTMEEFLCCMESLNLDDKH